MGILNQLAFVFPGQGSQSVGMLASLAEEETVIASTFAEASDVLGYDLWQIVEHGPEDKLNDTRITQPALLTAGVAMWKIWQQKTSTLPCVMAGHSLGEYTALVCANSLSFKDAVRLVAERGEYMQSAVPSGTGSMAAILGLKDEEINKICTQVTTNDLVVSAANYNSPTQVVISGHKAAVETVVELAKAAGAKRSVLLPVSVPSHCVLMREAAEKLEASLDKLTINTPEIPVLHNVDGRSHEDPSEIHAILRAQLHQPVQWSQTIQNLLDMGITHIFECGPGKVLSGLVKRIDKQVHALPLESSEMIAKAIATLSGDKSDAA